MSYESTLPSCVHVGSAYIGQTSAVKRLNVGKRHCLEMNETTPRRGPPSTNRAGLILYGSHINMTTTAIAAVPF